jgi:hypothetical protein
MVSPGMAPALACRTQSPLQTLARQEDKPGALTIVSIRINNIIALDR